MDLRVVWFVLLGVLLCGYAVLDGFDLGVGVLHLAARDDRERRLLLNSIGPIWDGNEVWLVTFGGALFAAFPVAYAASFSTFYLPFMLLLFALIFRAVSIEFRSKREARAWRAFWDAAFSGASALATFLMGLAVGNSMLGVPLGPDHEAAVEEVVLLRPYPLLVGALAVAAAAMHGAIYLHLKTEGELQARIRGWSWRAFGVFLALYMLVTIATLVSVPGVTRNFERYPAAWVVVVLNVLAIANVPRALHHGMPRYAFVSSSCTIAALIFLFGAAMFPRLVVSSLGSDFDVTVYGAASSEPTLARMLVIAVIGMPFVLTYTAIVYWVFRGKVKLGEFSY
jgi:cytochrome d ubiquinol oxidase subunit II